MITDANGDHPLLQPDRASNKPWRTKPIKFTSDYWTDGDCVAKTGDAYYSYSLVCYQGEGLELGHGGMNLRVDYAAQECSGGRLLFTAGESTRHADATILGEDVQCDPISAEFTVDPILGLTDAPWSTATATFDHDDPAESKCPCRKCSDANSPSGVYQGLYPDGDVILSYDIKEGIDEPRTGSVRLTMTPILDGSNDQLHKWVGNVDWWDEPSCTNPTNAPGGHNVELDCSGLSFLKWCGVGPGSGIPRTNRTTTTVGDVRFELRDATNAVKQGTLRAKDAPGAVLGDNFCCWPCDLPKKDLHLTVVYDGTPNPVPDNCPSVISVPTFGTWFSGVAKYSSVPYEMHHEVFGDLGIAWWKMSDVTPGHVDPFIQFPPPDPAHTYNVYLAPCAGFVYLECIQSVIDSFIIEFPLDNPSATCDPIHLEFKSRGGGRYCLGAPPDIRRGTYTTVTTLYVDEVEA